MTPTKPENSPPEDALGFEQWLLASARADELPLDVSAAWARLGASVASVGGVAAAGAAVSVGQHGAAVARIAALKWLMLGAVVGSALTALGMHHYRGRSHEGAPRANAVAHAQIPSAASVVAGAEVSAQPLSPTARAAPASPRLGSARPRQPAAASASTLSAQVALLDSARAALAAGAFAEALRDVDRYQHEFPKGELTPDSEVVAIEALAAAGEQAALSARASRFLARYPADPHTARVQAFVQR